MMLSRRARWRCIHSIWSAYVLGVDISTVARYHKKAPINKVREELSISSYSVAFTLSVFEIPLKIKFQTDYELDHHLHTAEIERLVATLGLCMCVRDEWREERGQEERIRLILLI